MHFKTKLDTSNFKGNLANPSQNKEVQQNIRKAVQASIDEIIKDVYDESQKLVPVKTGALKASGQIVKSSQPFDNGLYDSTVQYGNEQVAYAVYVHEDLTKHHLAPTQAKFLEIPLSRNRPRIIELMKTNIVKVWKK